MRKRSYLTISSVLLLAGAALWLAPSCAICMESLTTDTIAGGENGSVKEELALEAASPADENSPAASAREEVPLADNLAAQSDTVVGAITGDLTASDTLQPALSARSDKKEKGTNVKTKKVFTRELGLVDMPTRGENGWGLLSLDDCVAIAVKNHIPLQIAQKSMKLAELRVFEARRNMLPSASITFEEGHGRVNDLAYISRKQFIEGQQPVFHGGELYYTMKQAEVNTQITKNDYQKIKNELILQVKKGYYALCKAKGNLKLQVELSKEVERIFDMARKAFEAGVASKLEFLNVSSQAGQAKYQFTAAEGDVSVADLILKQAMNIDPRDALEINDDLEFKKVTVDFEKVLNAAALNRPEMKINSLMIDYYNYGKGVSKAKGWPKIDLMGQWGLGKDEYASPDQSNLPDGGDRKLEQQWYAGVKASMPFWGSTGEVARTMEHWPPVVSSYHTTISDTTTWKFKILDKLDYYSDKQLAEIDFDKARQELNKIRQDIALEARESCFNYQKAVIQADTAANKVRYQEKDLEFTKMKRGMDEVQDSNVIESMIKLAQERFGYLQALADCHTSLAGINKAIGVDDYFKDAQNQIH